MQDKDTGEIVKSTVITLPHISTKETVSVLDIQSQNPKIIIIERYRWKIIKNPVSNVILLKNKKMRKKC